ncbi:MAG: CPBP family intramembrane glutamic endopeptidase [Terriglobales bacterium]
MSRTLMDTDPVTPLNSRPEARSEPPSQPHCDPSADRQAAAPDSQSDSQPARHPISTFPPSLAPISPPTQLPEITRESALSPLAEIFVGPQGLYPATRWLIYLVLAYLTLELLNFLLSGLHPNPLPPWWTIVVEARMMLAAILPAFAMGRIEGRPFGDFGLPAKRAFGRDFWMGAIWGIAALTVLMLVLAAIGAFSFGSLSLHGSRIFKFAFYYAVFFLIAAFFEDFLLRGYSQSVLSRGMHFWPAAALLSILFGAMHLANPGEAKIGIAAVVAIGFFFCLTLRRTGTLWFAVGFHMAWDWGESYLYSVPDSGGTAPGHLLKSTFHGPDWLTGGSVGPEGSYLLFLLIAALWFLFSRAYPEVKYHEE